jgi:transitional endoplasmic reticulum ATPase
MPARRTLTFVPLDPEAFYNRYLLAETDEPDLTLAELLHDHPALCTTQVEPAYLRLKLSSLIIKVEQAVPGIPVYLPSESALADLAGSAAGQPAGEPARGGPAASDHHPSNQPGEPEPPPEPDPARHPAHLGDRHAVLIAHKPDIDQSASYLDAGLSVLIRCEKLLVEHLAGEIAARSGKAARTVRAAPPAGGGPRGDLMTSLQEAITETGSADVIVIPHLDLLAGGSDATLRNEARELTDLLYEHSERVILAFTDPSLAIPEVLASRFAIRLAIEILPRTARAADGTQVPIGQALVTESEAGLFDGFDAATLYKHIAGMNAVRLRHGLRFAYQQHAARDGKRPVFADLLRELRVFKARTSSAFEIPNVPLTAIGGYGDVKAELGRALEIIGGAAGDDLGLPARLRQELVPSGFIFHGPPGTGKTLFAKAIASSLNAMILVVSGPEITDMYVGESERKLRDLFAEARRNAPSVLVFDEFDSIAGRRTGRDDGGSRAGNAIVAQLLAELDGFRPEVPVLIIGTTNRVDIIDDALLRPSRFRPIKIDLPDREARVAIARVHASHFEIECGDELLAAIAAATEGMNGDEIRSIFRDARANELVGERRRTSACQLGELIGALRMSQLQRDIDKTRPFGRPAPGRGSRALTELTGQRTVTATIEPEQAAGPVPPAPRETEEDAAAS